MRRHLIPLVATSVAAIVVSIVPSTSYPVPRMGQHATIRPSVSVSAALPSWMPNLAQAPPTVLQQAPTTMLRSAPTSTVPTVAPPVTVRPRSPVKSAVGTANQAMSGGAFEACVIFHESRGDPSAQNPHSSASGLYGFLSSTWRNVTGTAGPARAYSSAIQHLAFLKLFASVGRSPWAGSGC
jgi:hypothetical protein